MGLVWGRLGISLPYPTHAVMHTRALTDQGVMGMAE